MATTDRLTSVALLADQARRRVTRYQLRKIQSTFPFLDLSAEIRNVIYVLCIDFNGIKEYFDKLYIEVLARKKDDHSHSRVQLKKKAPAIFLPNKQIYVEAIYLVRKEKVVFDHGLLEVRKLNKIIASNVLRQVSHIEVSDLGHDLLKGKILPESWHGYMRLLGQLADVLAGGHRLKSLSFHFKDKRLAEHMTTCFDMEPLYECGFRDGMRDAINNFRKVRGVGKVTFLGLNEELANQLKALMESKPKSFMDLPLELREMIYAQALDWSDVSRSLVRGIDKWPDARQPFPYKPRTTPTALLLNKQTSKEALKILRKKPLLLNFPAHVRIDEEKQVPHILGLISRRTLKHVKILHITMESWQWIYNISRSFVAALASSTSLEVLHFVIKDDLKPSFLKVSEQYYPDERLHATLKRLATIRGLKEVCFEGGDLPFCYTEPLMRIMTSPNCAIEALPKMRAITKSGEYVEIENEEQA